MTENPFSIVGNAKSSSDYEVLDDVLSKDELSTLVDLIIWNRDFPWYLRRKIESGDLEESPLFYGTHLFYYIGYPINLDNRNISKYCPIVQPIVNFITNFTGIKSILRVKGNFYPKTDALFEHQKHADFNYSHKSAIFYLNTCDGFTRLNDGTKIESVENRLLLFDGGELHNSSTCTDEPARFNINFNYL
tara:strand:+ start:273 stop:842 length:570 start_codon:yes stop_codon:yes gene_type:complete